jgi:hypothetical protein
MVLIVLVFLPLYFFTNHKEQLEKKNPVYSIVGYLTIALLLAGATFKIMHWPGAGSMIYASVGFLLIGFVPLYVVNAFQRSGKEKANLPYIVMLLVGIAIVLLFSNINMSKYRLDVYLEHSLKNEAQVETVQQKTRQLLEWAQDSTYADKLASVTRIHDRASELQVMIQDMQDGMKAQVNESGTPIAELAAKDNKQAGRLAILEHGAGKAFMSASIAYGGMLMELVSDPVTQNQIKDHLEYTSYIYEIEHGPDGVADSPLMKNYYKNTDAAKGIALSEYVAISYILNH